jgi:hypothetical protein
MSYCYFLKKIPEVLQETALIYLILHYYMHKLYMVRKIIIEKSGSSSSAEKFRRTAHWCRDRNYCKI